MEQQANGEQLEQLVNKVNQASEGLMVLTENPESLVLSDLKALRESLAHSSRMLMQCMCNVETAWSNLQTGKIPSQSTSATTAAESSSE